MGKNIIILKSLPRKHKISKMNYSILYYNIRFK